MIQWTCDECDNRKWELYGRIVNGRPNIKRLKCGNCGNIEEP